MSRITFNQALAGTQYISLGGEDGLDLGTEYKSVSWTIEHPAATTTTYTVQGSNMDDDDIRLGRDDWFDYSGITIGEISTEQNIGVGWTKFAYARARIKAVTTVGSGTNVTRQYMKRSA